MKVLLVSNDTTIADATRSAYIRVRDLAEHVDALHVLIPGTVAGHIDAGKLQIHMIRAEGLFRSLTVSSAIRSVVRKEHVDAVWVVDPFDNGRIVAQSARRLQVPFYLDIETDFLSPWFGITKRVAGVHSMKSHRALPHARSIQRILSQARGIRVTSERMKTALMHKYGTKIPVPEVIPVPITGIIPDPIPFPVPPFPFSIITVGHLTGSRRVEDVLEAVALLQDRYPGIGLFVVGDGPARQELEHYVSSHGLTDKVVFLGDRSDVWGIMRSAQVFVHASGYEGYGRRILQAALARVPIITTPVGIVGEVFKDYQDVLPISPGDTETLAKHLVGLMHDVQARKLLSIHAEAAARAYLSASGDIPARLATFLGTSTPLTPTP